jgi:hypothetical protein
MSSEPNFVVDKSITEYDTFDHAKWKTGINFSPASERKPKTKPRFTWNKRFGACTSKKWSAKSSEKLPKFSEEKVKIPKKRYQTKAVKKKAASKAAIAMTTIQAIVPRYTKRLSKVPPKLSLDHCRLFSSFGEVFYESLKNPTH